MEYFYIIFIAENVDVHVIQPRDEQKKMTCVSHLLVKIKTEAVIVRFKCFAHLVDFTDDFRASDRKVFEHVNHCGLGSFHEALRVRLGLMNRENARGVFASHTLALENRLAVNDSFG